MSDHVVTLVVVAENDNALSQFAASLFDPLGDFLVRHDEIFF
jgi:hypothetical protein